MKATIDGAAIEYDVRGEGPAILLLHAFPLGLFTWDAQADALATTHRVVRFDARGFGGSAPGRVRSPWSGSRTTAPRSSTTSGSRRRSWAAARWAATRPSPSCDAIRSGWPVSSCKTPGPGPTAPRRRPTARHSRRGCSPRAPRWRSRPSCRSWSARRPIGSDQPRRPPARADPLRVAPGHRERPPRPRRARGLPRDAADDRRADAGARRRRGRAHAAGRGRDDGRRHPEGTPRRDPTGRPPGEPGEPGRRERGPPRVPRPRRGSLAIAPGGRSGGRGIAAHLEDAGLRLTAASR